MFNAQQFFNERFSAHLKEISRYLRYIFTGHLVIAMLFIVSALAFYYQQWLAIIPENFPSVLIISLLFSIVASYSPVRTLLKEPDLVFLLPAEHKMGPYFRSSLIYSFVVQLYLVFLIAAVLGPLYFASFPVGTNSPYILVIVILLVLKVWNLFANWWILKIRDIRSRTIDHTIRFLLNFFTFFFFINGEVLFAGITTILLFGLFMYDFYLSKQNVGIVWDLLVEKDRMRMRTFYRIANMFTDVPHLKTQIKKRHWLVALIVRNVPYKQEKTFAYLYRITTIRSGEYLGIYSRLFIIGALSVYFIPNMGIQIAFSILFIYLSGFQMMTLWQHYRTIAWLDIYPVKKEWREQAFTSWLLALMLSQTLLFGLLFMFLGNISGLVIVWLGGTLFSYLFVHGYVKKRLT
ncbi:ABC transporter permease [Aquibacillus halophilus]|uniref:ABC transporter permease n=1 Tax=Aquibacillus halophilus TaxID=930132 RepID=A0A6A8DI02_9BACI|nr:ABC transporter permease [Aquibacillus halophilus]MRH44136.1 ABC transporter permease [Aquibacillus halophilus]